MRPPGLLRTSDIAELAGVTVSTVSNWRKRYKGSFPAPVAASDGGRPLFRYTEVRSWLESSGRAPSAPVPGQKQTMGLSARVWDEINLVQAELGPDQAAFLICSLIAWASAVKRFDLADSPAPVLDERRLKEKLAEAGFPEPPAVELFDPQVFSDRFVAIASALTDLHEADLCELFDWQLDRAGRAMRGRSTIFTTSDEISDILVALAISEPSLRPGQASLLDPACGTGRLLLTCAAELAGDEGTVYCFGQDINVRLVALAWQRSIVSGVPAELAVSDSLAQDAFPGQLFDVVVADPPFGARSTDVIDQPWTQGLGGRTLDLAWLGLCLAHLSDAGRAYVVLPVGSLFRAGREAEVRREMVRRGAVEAIITLPTSIRSDQTRVGQCIWVLRNPEHRDRDEVLLLDGSHDSFAGFELAEALGDVLAAWRSGESIPEGLAGGYAVKPTIELVGGETTLQPTEWISSVVTEDQREALRQKLAESIDLLSEITLPAPALQQIKSLAKEASSSAKDIEWTKIRELIERGQASLLRPVPPKRRDEQLGEDESVEVGIWTPRDLTRLPAEQLPTERTRVRAGLASRRMTKPGDIIVPTVGPNRLRAVVDREGGNVISSNLVGLRLDASLIPPELAVAALNAPRNVDLAERSVRGTTVPRIRLEELELPEVDTSQSERLLEALRSAEELERLGEQIAAAARQVISSLVEVGRSPR